MSEKLLAPDLRRILADLARRIGILERRISPTATANGTPANDDIIFSYAGDLASGTESPPVKLHYSGFLATVSVALGTAGSTDTSLEINRNGSVIATITVPDAVFDWVVVVGARVNGEDRISLTVATAGTGAADMTLSARFT